MNTLIQHAQLIIKMKNCGLRSNLIKKFSQQDIIKSCDRIEKSDLKKFDYSQYPLIQEELIRDEKIIKPIQLAFKGKYDINILEKFLEQITKHNEKMSDYDYKDIFKVLNAKELRIEAYYDYLKHYINENYKTRKNVIDNLNYFYSQYEVSIDELGEKEINLIKTHLLNNINLIPKENIKKILELLSKNQNLLNLIDYLFKNKLYIQLDLEKYQIINKDSKEIENYIKEIYFKIKDQDIMYRLLLKWINNGCSLYDLKIINSKMESINNEKLEKILQNRTSYINYIYGDKLKKFPLDSLFGKKEELVVYAIRKNKNSFLRLIEENMTEFLEIPSNSVLYYDKFYKIYINLNELTLKNIEGLKKMKYESYYNLYRLKEQKYTFAEISTLYNVNIEYIDLYNELLDLKIDKRMLIIRQLLKKHLLDEIDNLDARTLADRLKEKPLYTWIEFDFNNIKDLSASDTVKILIKYDKIQRFLKEVTNKSELSYILRNFNNIEKYNNLQEIKNDIEKIDIYWTKLKNIMNFSDDIISKYKDNIHEFLLNNGAELAYEYYKSQNIEQKEAFKLIVKATIMGEFKKLKYHTSDLEKEIDYKLKGCQIEEWCNNNIEINNEKYNIKEYDDFYHTMILGEYPKKTCLNYRHGGYNSCLLACFDSNKKILYAKINDKIVARAMVRLTKGSNTKVENTLKSLSFIDVEKDKQMHNNEIDEKLTLFLERPYIAGITRNDEIKVKKLFAKLLKEKAKKMNALLVLSNDYYDICDENFVSKSYYMYISKSKSSAQYLDSLSGQATVSDVGEYKKNTFLIWNNIKKENANTLDSIMAA